jgi:cytidine kinase
VRLQPQYPTLRAWQILEEDGRRTQIWRTRGSVIPAHLAFAPDLIPPAYWGARGFHFGIHPEHPNLAIMQALRARGTIVSVEPFRAAERRLTDEELGTLLGSCDIFSPNLEEASSLVGDGPPDQLVARLAAAGASLVALRMGAVGSLVYAAATGTMQHIPAVPVTVVDQVGAGNAYCGGFLVGWLETGDLRLAGLYASVAASFLVEQYGLPKPRADMHAEAAERLATLM